jgi:Zn-dependent peptidase ImmA (M78 family)
LGHGYVDIFDVLRQLEFEVYRKPFSDGLEGALTVRDGVTFIFVNSLGSLTRQRLTAAHELGHYELGEREEGTEVLEGPALNGDGEEWEVFRFARHFLMDAEGIRTLVSQISDEEQRVAAVAHRFVTSPTVTAIHLRELGMISAATKARLKEQFDAGLLRPSAFLGRYGYGMDEMNQQVTELAPAHIQRSLTAYSHGLLSLVALAEVLMKTEAETEQIVREAGIDVPEDRGAAQELAVEA